VLPSKVAIEKRSIHSLNAMPHVKYRTVSMLCLRQAWGSQGGATAPKNSLGELRKILTYQPAGK
jgi:hypothetical protein